MQENKILNKIFLASILLITVNFYLKMKLFVCVGGDGVDDGMVVYGWWWLAARLMAHNVRYLLRVICMFLCVYVCAREYVCVCDMPFSLYIYANKR